MKRAGVLTGRTEFGGRDWYGQGARFLLAQKAADGSWTDPTGAVPQDTLGTSFALLFLSRAK